MRKLLLTTTALAVTAGAAAAEVSISGSAEMGIAGSKDDSARFHTDVQVSFGMSGETDGGLTFGTSVDLSEVDGTKDGATGNDDAHGGVAIYLNGPFGNLTLGDTDGGFDWAVGETGVGGAIRDDNEHGAYNGAAGLDGTHDGQILRYDNALGVFGFAASLELDDEVGGSGGQGDSVFGVGLKYSMAMPDGGSVGVGLGYQMGAKYHAMLNGLRANNAAFGADAAMDAMDQLMGVKDEMTAIGASVNMAFAGGLKAIGNYTRKTGEATGMTGGEMAASAMRETDESQIGLGLGYEVDNITLGVNWGRKETETTFVSTARRMMTSEVTGIGFAAVYDLGGGASLKFGVGSDETSNSFSDSMDMDRTDDMVAGSKGNTWSLGLAFGF